jgi:RimJ/RimL family protein N-acetyltransferase
MEIVSLDRALEPTFWDHVKQDIPHYYFFAFDWKHNREATEILLALEEERIDGMMLVYNERIVQLRGSNEAAEAFLERLDLDKIEIQSPKKHKQLILKKYKPTLGQSHEMMLMVVHKGEEELHMRHPAVELDAADVEKMVEIMRDADPEYWGDVTGERILEGMSKGANWLGIKVNENLVSIGMSRLTEWTGLVGVAATHEEHRNRGYATSIVSRLVKEILERLPLAMIYVLADNPPAIRAYKKVGFKPHTTYFFMRGERF